MVLAAASASCAALGLPLLASPGLLAVNADHFSWVPDASVDFVLTDPPFNIARDTNFHTYKNNTINSFRFDKDKGWDSYEPQDFIVLLNQWAVEFARVLKPGGRFVIFCADAYLSHLSDALRQAGLLPKRTVVWRKPNAVPVNRKSLMMSACEYMVMGVKKGKGVFNADLSLEDAEALREIEAVLVADKAAAVVEKRVRSALAAVEAIGQDRVDAVAASVSAAVQAAAVEAAGKAQAMYVTPADADAYFRACVPNFVSFNSKSGSRLHPTEKPVELLQFLLRLFSSPNTVVLDPFAGSGSTAAACLATGRQVITVEQDAEFFTKLSLRLAPSV